MAVSCHCTLLRGIAPVPSLFVRTCQMILVQGQKCSLPSQYTGPGNQSRFRSPGFIYLEVVSYLCTSWAWRLVPAGEKGALRAHAHRHARTLPNPEALGPDIEEGAFNRRPLQALFPLPRVGAGPNAGPGAILLQSTNSVRVVGSSKKLSRRPFAIERSIGRGSATNQDETRPSYILLPLIPAYYHA